MNNEIEVKIRKYSIPKDQGGDTYQFSAERDDGKRLFIVLKPEDPVEFPFRVLEDFLNEGKKR